MLFGHGDDYYRSSREIRVNYSSNVWYGADLAPLREHIYQSFYQVARYPEPDAASLRQKLAGIYNVSAEHLLVTNGSITAFYLIAEAWRGAKSTIFIPSFAEYEDACRLHQHQLSFFTNSLPLSELSLEDTALCWLCNPNNPDGHVIAREELLQLIRKNPHTFFVIDQVYSDFYPEKLLEIKDVEEYPNLILVQSISKLHKIPGIRIGYVAASKEIIRRLENYLIPWSVNALAVEVGKYTLSHPEQFVLPLQQWLEDTHRLQEAIRKTGIEVLPSSVTFFLCRLPEGKKASDLKTFLLDRQEILIRDASNFRGLDERYFRLSTQRPEENRQLVELLQEYLSKDEGKK